MAMPPKESLVDVKPRRLRIVLRLGIGLFLAVLVCRTWLLLGLVVPVQIAGDSMAETMLGPHQQVTCASCDHQFRVGVFARGADDAVLCPRCQVADKPGLAEDIQSGESVLVDRTAFQLRPPRRWEAVVFRCPQQGNELCVKRVVGLPGERILLRAGDVYADDQLCRKNLRQQRAVRQLVDRVSESHLHSRWRGERGSTAWRQVDSQLVIQAGDAAAKPSGIDWLAYRHIGGRPITDHLAYNQDATRRLNDVADIMLDGQFQIESPAAKADGQLTLSMTDFRDLFEVRISPASHWLVVERNGEVLWEGSVDSSDLTRPTRIELSLFDRQVLLALDGLVCVAHPYDASDRPRRPTSSPVAIGVRGLSLTVDRLTIWRDIYYGALAGGSSRHGLSRPCQLGRGELFVLGDNSPISLDSRIWPKPGLAAKFLVGKPLGFE